MSDSRRLTPHPNNCKLRLDFLADCRANGMDEHRVQQRYATTEHLIRQADDKELWEYNIGELKQLLADTQALSSGQVGKPLSHERLRKVFLHARELLTYASDAVKSQEAKTEKVRGKKGAKKHAQAKGASRESCEQG